MKNSTVLAAAMAMGLAFHAHAKTYTPVFTEDFENAATWHDNVQYGSVSNAYFNMATLNLGGTDYQLSQSERTLADGVSTTKFYQQASSSNQKRNSAFIIPDSVLTSLGNDYMLEFDLGFNAPYAKDYSTNYRAGLSVNDANGLPLLTIGTVYGNGNGERTTGCIYRGDDIDDAIASNFRVTGRDQVITNSVYAKNWLHVKLTVSGSSMSVTATLADGAVLCSDAAVSTGITSPVKYLGLRSWSNMASPAARCGLDNISMSKAIEGTFVWTGEAGDCRWSNPGNWQISGLAVVSAPGAGDAVSISDATVAIDPDFDLSGVTATLSNAKIAVLFTDSALSYAVPAGFDAGDFVASGPYSVEVSGGVITATRIPSSFAWAGGSSGEWSDTANWMVGGMATGVIPTSGDTAVFSDDVSATLSASHNVSNLVVATGKTLTLNGGILANIYEYGTASEKGGTVALNGSELRSYNISGSSASWYGDIEIAGGASVTNYIRATISTMGASGTLNLYGNLSGDGCVVLHVVGHNTNGQPDGQGGVSLYGDNQNFEGIGIIRKGGANNNRGPATFCSATAGSAKARWVYPDAVEAHTGARSGTIAVDNAATPIQFGTYEGKSYIFGCTSHSGNTIEIGGADTDFTCSLSARSAAAERANNSATLKKVGIGTMTFGEEVGNPCFNTYEMNGGVLKFANMYITRSATSSTGYMNPTFTFTGGTLALDDCATNTVDESLLDLSPYIKNSTAAISVFVDEAQTMTWGTALAAQTVDAETGRDGGLTKLGAGTLTLEQVPLYTGLTTVKEGTLVVPEGSDITYNPLSEGTLTGVTPTKFAYPAGTTLTGAESSKTFDGTLDVSNVTAIDVSDATLTEGTPFVVAAATTVTGFTKDTIELTLPAGTDPAKWTVKIMSIDAKRSLCVAPPTNPFVIIVR